MCILLDFMYNGMSSIVQMEYAWQCLVKYSIVLSDKGMCDLYIGLSPFGGSGMINTNADVLIQKFHWAMSRRK